MAPLPALGEALDEPRLAAMTGEDDGVRHRDAIHELLAARLIERTTDEWVAFFDAFRLWSGPVATYAELLEHPQLDAMEMIGQVEYPDGSSVRMPAPPLRLSATPATIRGAPPRLGADTERALNEWLGWDERQTKAAQAAGAFGAPRSDEVEP